MDETCPLSTRGGGETPSHEYSVGRQKRRRARVGAARRAAPVSLLRREMQDVSAIVTRGRGAQRRTGRGARALWGVHAHDREEPALLLQQEGGSGAARRSTSLIISECGFSFTSLIATRCGFSFTSLVATQFGWNPNGLPPRLPRLTAMGVLRRHRRWSRAGSPLGARRQGPRRGCPSSAPSTACDPADVSN